MNFEKIQKLKNTSPQEKDELLNRYFISKNIILISNLPEELYSKEHLYQKKYLGQYGHIIQILFDKNNKNNKSIIVQFDTNNQSALAVLFLDNLLIKKNQRLKVSYFITKYCYNFINNEVCYNSTCLFIHDYNINEYLYSEINHFGFINNVKFASNVLNIPLKILLSIKSELFGENYYLQNQKFPKITMKKLKNKDFIKNISSKEKNYKKNEFKSYKNSSEDDSINTNNTSNNWNYSLIYKLKRKNQSRFNFIKNDINKNESVFIPEFVLDFLDKSIFNYNNNDLLNNDYNINIDNFNCKWSIILFGKNNNIN
jgi:hypothetical protein